MMPILKHALTLDWKQVLFGGANVKESTMSTFEVSSSSS